MNIEATLQDFIAREFPSSERNEVVRVDEPLVSSGRVDSLGLLQILTFIEQEFGVDLMVSANPNDFDTVAGLAKAVRGVKPDGR